ncbi:glycosyltransferase family 39 protein [Ruegeria arenilitoris]|uniref:glycosyltransferase family 39 protein n=1 Tax=Ruegeria arenilitoris TaxID=1173585 RepID=UPI003C7E4786
MSSGVKAEEKPDTLIWRLLLICIFLSAAVFRLLRIEAKEVWLDEVMTWHYAKQPWSEVVRFVSENDVHPPLHFLFTKIFLVFGDGAFALRIGTVLLELMALPLIYWAAFSLAPKERKHMAGLVAMVLAASSGAMIVTGLLARSYAGLYLSFTVCFACLSWLATHKEAASISIFNAQGARARLCYGGMALGLAGMAWLHNLGLLYCAAVGLIAIAIWLFILDRNAAAFTNFLVAAGIALLLYLPQLATLLTQLNSVSSEYWVPQPRLSGLIRSVLQVFGQSPALDKTSIVEIGLATFICFVGLFATLSLFRQRNWTALFLTIGLLAAVYGLFLLVTYGVKPVLLNRAVFPMLAPWFVLLALGVVALPKLGQRWVLATGLTSILLFAAAQVTDNFHWRGRMLQRVVQDAQSTPTLITVPNSASIMLNYHAQQLGLSVNTVPLPAPYPDHAEGSYFATGWPGVPAVNDRALETIEATLANHSEDVWLYLRGYWIYDPDALLKPYLDHGYCYQPIDDIPGKLDMLFKLTPRDALASGECDDMGNDEYFPYIRPKYGRFSLLELSP